MLDFSLYLSGKPQSQNSPCSLRGLECMSIQGAMIFKKSHWNVHLIVYSPGVKLLTSSRRFCYVSGTCGISHLVIISAPFSLPRQKAELCSNNWERKNVWPRMKWMGSRQDRSFYLATALKSELIVFYQFSATTIITRLHPLSITFGLFYTSL